MCFSAAVGFVQSDQLTHLTGITLAFYGVGGWQCACVHVH